jgi:ectonucleotide pyrophosphatase/phosphodiesterase family protein 5
MVLKFLKKTACLFMLAAAGHTHASAIAAPVPVILVSIDGFRPDYLERGVTPNLNQLAAGGARATGMLPSFPSVTFPNHYTLVTGLRPDHHGIVDNTMTDAGIPGVRFSMSNAAAVTDRRWWDQAEPVWVTAELHGIRSGTMFWPGSEAAIHGVRPTISPRFDGKLPADARVDQLLSWLARPAGEQLGFMTLYFDDVDHAGHDFGPADDRTLQAVAHVDQAVGRLVAGLRQRGVFANIVIVSDHGMAPLSTERIIRMDRIAPEGSYKLAASGSYAAMDATAGQEEVLAAALLRPQEHMQCWRKADIPARLAYGHNARVPGYLCLGEPGWLLLFNDKSTGHVRGGAHGYDNAAPDMRATFIAAGPAIKPGVMLQAFDNVDVYPLLMRLLGLQPLPSDGDITPLLPALNAP